MRLSRELGTTVLVVTHGTRLRSCDRVAGWPRGRRPFSCALIAIMDRSRCNPASLVVLSFSTGLLYELPLR
jgi:hypothetical protein